LRGQVVITSKDSRQIDHQIWPAIVRHSDKFSDWSFTKRHVKTPLGGEIILYTTDEPGRAEGWHHELPDKPLLLIFDEAKSIPEQIFMSADRCTYNGLLMISSTGVMQGRFYDAFHSKVDQFRTRTVTVDECPHVPKERVEDVLLSYGPEHPFTRSTLYSEFMSEDSESVFLFTLADLRRLLENPPDERKSARRVFFCDFAAGGDENVLAVREGNRVEIIKCWRESNDMAVVGQYVRLFKAAGAQASEIWGDAGGLGKTMCARLEELGWAINRFNGGERAYRDYEYVNRNAEIWEIAAKAVKDQEIILPEDEKLLSQLVSRKRGKPDSRGRLSLESKDEMRRRGLKSPDRADAVVGVIAIDREPMNSPSQIEREWRINQDYEEPEYFGIEGVHAGL
jgi:hypothetical protein